MQPIPPVSPDETNGAFQGKIFTFEVFFVVVVVVAVVAAVVCSCCCCVRVVMKLFYLVYCQEGYSSFKRQANYVSQT